MRNIEVLNNGCYVLIDLLEQIPFMLKLTGLLKYASVAKSYAYHVKMKYRNDRNGK